MACAHASQARKWKDRALRAEKALESVRFLLKRQGQCGEAGCTEVATCEVWPILDAWLGGRSLASPAEGGGDRG